ncbi:hypothetical protein PAPYR_2664 [Paratrimastix pyriformis]|uniref:Carboxypeptidase n=1 Tax=Paratrimastix pyriformis TaxID=342808 RepID=A0ABQ8UVR2_9EUKA|nr:hypothetical protein PAPYR_2664 [Paratrimastix pyriformis]
MRTLSVVLLFWSYLAFAALRVPRKLDEFLQVPQIVKDDHSAVYVSRYLDHPELAQNLTRIHNLFGDQFAYSGYITTQPSLGSNLFYLFFEARNGNKKAPVLLWLQGGPGGSSLFGCFSEVGPFELTGDPAMPSPRKLSWGNNYAMLFIDNPVMTGFSYTEHEEGYSHTEAQVADNLYKALQQFFTIHPEYQKNEFYLTGESYAGKYIPALGARIDAENRRGGLPFINLKGLAIGDGLVDPITQIGAYADVLGSFGMAGDAEVTAIAAVQQRCQAAIAQAQWREAGDCFADLINGPPDLIQNITHTNNYYDLRTTNEPSYGPDEGQFANRSDVRAALHVGSHYFQESAIPYLALYSDMMQSEVTDLVLLLTAGYKVALYNGQYDLIVAPATTAGMLSSLPWVGTTSFLQQPMRIWKVDPADGEIAGYVRSFKNLQYIVVRDAGHILPFNQPRRALDLITRFVENKPFF